MSSNDFDQSNDQTNGQSNDYGRENESQVLSDYSANMGNFAYMPKTFLGISTENLGFSRKMAKSPFIELKEKIISDTTISIDDKMQGVRYLCSIPYANGIKHCLEAVKHIIRDENVSVYKRLFFIHNNEKFFKLDDHVAHMSYPMFFRYGLETNGIKVPFDCMLICVEHIFSSFGSETNIRQAALDWCLDIVENQSEDIHTVYDVLNLLKEKGQSDEIDYANDQLVELCGEYSEPSMFELNAKDILRTLIIKHSKVMDNLPTLDHIVEEIGKRGKGDFTIADGDWLKQVLNDLSIDTIKGCDIVRLIFGELSGQLPFVQDECFHRIFNEVLKCEGNHRLLYMFIAILDGFVQPTILNFSFSLIEKFRNDVFEALNESLFSV